MIGDPIGGYKAGVPGLLIALAILAIVGHIVLVRASLDAVYRLGLNQRLWHVLFAIHILFGIGAPLGCAWLMAGSRWAGLHGIAMAYGAMCLLALLFGVIVLIRRSLAASPTCCLASHTTTRCAAESLGVVPVSPNWRSPLARLPGNEVCHVDLVEHQVRLPRLPHDLDGLSILHLSDLHMNGTPDHRYFEWAAELCSRQKADLIALTGDIIDHMEIATWLPTTLGRLEAPLGCYFILGNHDIHVDADGIRSAVEGIGWTWLGGRCVSREMKGHAITIAGTEHPWTPESPNLNGAASQNLTILLSHSPHEIRWARRQGVDLMLARHLHGGQIRLPWLGPISGGRLASGVFACPPTVLHVSRGLGQMLPLRWGCRPEITKIVLRAS